MPATSVRVTFIDEKNNYVQRDMPMPNVRKFRQMMADKGLVLVSSRPITSK